MVYAVLADVEARCRWIVGSTGFTSTSTPTDDDVEAWLGDASNQIDQVLLSCGLPAPYTDSSAVERLKNVACDYAEGWVRRTRRNTGMPIPDDSEDPMARFERELQSWRENPTRIGQELGAGDAPDSSVLLSSHVTDGVDGKSAADFAPTFTRGTGISDWNF